MKTVLFQSPDFAVSVCQYRPGERHGVHTDQYSRISFLLRGAYQEEGPTGVVRMRPGEVLLKSFEAKHEDVFGEAGAVLVALEFFNDDPFALPAHANLWRKRGDAAGLRHALAYLEAAIASDADAIATAGADLVTADNDGAVAKAPAWLKQLRDDLRRHSLAELNVSVRAREAGVHPAHLSRLFRRCFGRSLTEQAQLESVRRAIERLAEPASKLSDVAAQCGFYDQSHMNRVFMRVTGRTPGAHRALYASC